MQWAFRCAVYSQHSDLGTSPSPNKFVVAIFIFVGTAFIISFIIIIRGVDKNVSCASWSYDGL
eukprot:262998-Amphidinium_carterae.2